MTDGCKHGVKTKHGRGRLQEATPPLRKGFCDFCGSAFPDGTPTHTRRGDLRKYCDKSCRLGMRKREAAAATFLYNRILVARVFKHADPDRANKARAELADFVAEHLQELDEGRRHAMDADGVERTTTRETRRAAKL